METTIDRKPDGSNGKPVAISSGPPSAWLAMKVAVSDIDEALELNSTAVAEYLTVAFAVPASQWTEPRRRGEWSPGQITEHLAIVCEIARQLIDGTAVLHGRTPPAFLRPHIRAVIRVTVLRSGKFFRKSKAPGDFEPSSRPASQQLLCERLRCASDAFEQRVRARASAGDRRTAASVLWPLADREFVTLQTYHTRHHGLQIIDTTTTLPKG